MTTTTPPVNPPAARGHVLPEIELRFYPEGARSKEERTNKPLPLLPVHKYEFEIAVFGIDLDSVLSQVQKILPAILLRGAARPQRVHYFDPINGTQGKWRWELISYRHPAKKQSGVYVLRRYGLHTGGKAE